MPPKGQSDIREIHFLNQMCAEASQALHFYSRNLRFPEHSHNRLIKTTELKQIYSDTQEINMLEPSVNLLITRYTEVQEKLNVCPASHQF